MLRGGFLHFYIFLSREKAIDIIFFLSKTAQLK